MDDLGHVNDSPMTSEPTVGEIKEKDYPETEFCAEEMTSLKGLTIGDQVTMTIQGEVIGVEKRKNYGSNDKNGEKTEVRIKMISGMAKKTGGEVVDEVNKQDQKEEENKDTETTTLKDKKEQVVNKFNKIISKEDEE